MCARLRHPVNPRHRKSDDKVVTLHKFTILAVHKLLCFFGSARSSEHPMRCTVERCPSTDAINASETWGRKEC